MMKIEIVIKNSQSLKLCQTWQITPWLPHPQPAPNRPQTNDTQVGRWFQGGAGAGREGGENRWEKEWQQQGCHVTRWATPNPLASCWQMCSPPITSMLFTCTHHLPASPHTAIDELHSLLSMYFHIFVLLVDDHMIVPYAAKVTWPFLTTSDHFWPFPIIFAFGWCPALIVTPNSALCSTPRNFTIHYAVAMQ